MTQKERHANKVLKMITEGKENLLVENPLLMGLLRMGLMNYLFGDVVKTQVDKLSQRYPDLSPTELLKKAGLDVKASEKELEKILKAVKDEMGEYSSTFSSIRDTQLYSDLMEAVEEAVTRHVDMKVMIDIIKSLK
jgi:Glu-tRNA(Gln) amidotransferase subunit E-like FAD-binding protein